MTWQVEKMVAVGFLEAVRTALQDMGAYRMQLAERGEEGPESFSTTYGSVRRLRDHLQRCTRIPGQEVDLDVDEDDANLLVSCAAHAIRRIDGALGSEVERNVRERQWLEQKREQLVRWGVELATEILTDLPLPASRSFAAGGLRMLQSGISRKLGGKTRRAASHDGHGVYFGAGVAEAVTAGAGADTGGPRESSRDEGKGTRLLEPRSLGDPRLRGLIALDLRAYQRAVAARDHRLAAVHLGSVLEGAALDHAMSRRAEFGLEGEPSTWNLEGILEQVLDRSKDADPGDRGQLHDLVRARHLISPAHQLEAPMAVTASSFAERLAFARRLLAGMGLTSESTPPTLDTTA